MQRAVGADGDVGAPHIVVDGAHQPDNGQVRVACILVLINLAVLAQLVEDARPLRTQHVRAGQAAVAADDDEAVDTVLNEVVGRTHAPLTRAKLGATCGADDGAAHLQDAAHRVPADGTDIVATVDESLVAFVDGKDFSAAIEASPHHRAQRRIHPLCITATCKDANAFHFQNRPFCFLGISISQMFQL